MLDIILSNLYVFIFLVLIKTVVSIKSYYNYITNKTTKTHRSNICPRSFS